MEVLSSLERVLRTTNSQSCWVHILVHIWPEIRWFIQILQLIQRFLETIVSMIIWLFLIWIHTRILVYHLVLLSQLLEKRHVSYIAVIWFMRISLHTGNAYSWTVCSWEGASVEVGGGILASLGFKMQLVPRLRPRSWECSPRYLPTSNCIFLAYREATCAVMIIGTNSSLRSDSSTSTTKWGFHRLSIFITTDSHNLIVFITLRARFHWQGLIVNPVVIFDACFHFKVIYVGILGQFDLVDARFGVETVFEEVALFIELLVNIRCF